MAQIPGSIRVTGFIAPTDTTDTYKTHDEVYGGGGYRTVATLVERTAIPADRRKEGMLVKVLNAGGGQTIIYTLVGGITDSHWQEQSFGGESTLLTGEGNPNGTTSGTLGQTYLDTLTYLFYRNINGLITWTVI
jgi:hypothetical protein